MVFTCGECLVGCFRLSEGVRTIVAEKGVNGLVPALDLVQASLHAFPRGNRFCGEACPQFRNRQLIEHWTGELRLSQRAKVAHTCSKRNFRRFSEYSRQGSNFRSGRGW